MSNSARPLDEMLVYNVPPTARVAEIKSLIELCGELIETGQDAHRELAQLNGLSRIKFDDELLADYWRSTSAQELAVIAASEPPPVIAGITRDQLIAVAAQIQAEVGGDQGALRWYLDLFEVNTPSGTSDLFFWPTKVSGWQYTGGDIATAEPTPEEIVDRALVGDN